MLDLPRLRLEFEQFGYEMACEEYENLVGLRDEVATAAIFEKYAHLHTRETLAGIRALCPQDPDEQRRTRYLELDVLDAIVGADFAEEEDQLETEATREVVVLDGQRIPWRSLSTVLRETSDRDKRRRLVALNNDLKRKYLPREEDLERRSRQAYLDHGYGDDAQRWMHAHGIDLHEMDRLCQAFLRESEATYVKLLAARVRDELGLPLDALESHDVAYMMRAKRFDAHFPKDRGAASLFDMHAGMGFDLRAMPNVRLDMEDRPKKDPRAFVMPARVPHDVRLVTRPRGGVDDYRSLYHESGHALHFALTREDLPYEWRYMGDSGVTESYAFLFEHLLENPLHLRECAPDLVGDELRDYLRYSALDKLMSVRYYAATLHYDLFLATHTLEEARPRYVEGLTDALKYPANPLDYLGTDGFYGMWYLRAWLFEAMHRRWLEREFGPTWWHEPSAGAHLRAWYAHGEKPTCEDLAGQIGHARLDADALVQDLDRLARADVFAA